MVRNGCARRGPGQLNSEEKEKVRVSLLQIVKAHRSIKEFFRPYLDSSAIKEIFFEDNVDTLRQRNNKLKQDRASFEKQLYELSKSDNDRQQNYVELQKRCCELEQEVENCKRKDDETAYRRQQQQQLEETLKTQNSLIENLERRLSDSEKEKEILKELNRSLQVELKKTKSLPNLGKTMQLFDTQENTFSSTRSLAPKPTVRESKKVFDRLTKKRLSDSEIPLPDSQDRSFLVSEPVVPKLTESVLPKAPKRVTKQNSIDLEDPIQVLDVQDSGTVVPTVAAPNLPKDSNTTINKGFLDLDKSIGQTDMLYNEPFVPKSTEPIRLEIPYQADHTGSEHSEKPTQLTDALGNQLLDSELVAPELPDPPAALEYAEPVLQHHKDDDAAAQKSLELLDKIRADLGVIVEKCNQFSGTKGDRLYVYLRESLIRTMIKLDRIRPNGNRDIETQRRETIWKTQQFLDQLESISEN